MSYYMRFIQTDDEPVTLEVLRDGLQEEDDYTIDENGRLCLSNSQCAEIQIHRPGDTCFEKEIATLSEAVRRIGGPSGKRVLKSLDGAQSLVIVRVLWQDRQPEETLQKIDPLWRWLFENRNGLVQADDEGYYVRSRRILAVE